MRYAVCNELFAGWELPRLCSTVAAMGYQGIEFAPFTFAPDGVHAADGARWAEIRRTVADAGLQAIGLHWLLVGPKGLHLTASDPDVRRRTAEYLCTLVDCCAEIGGHVLVLGSPKQRDLQPGVTLQQGLGHAADTLADAVRRAEAAGVRWSLEPLPSADTNFLNTLDECLDLDRRLGAGPGVGVHLDVKSLCAEAEDPSAPAPVILRHAPHAGRFVHFHANDRNLGGPGSGDVAFPPIFAALRETGYDGWVSVEVFDMADGAETIARNSLEYMRSSEG